MPGRETIRQEGRIRGGHNKSREARARKLIARGMDQMSDIDDVLRMAMLECYVGKLDPKIAVAMASLARTIKDIAIASQYEQQLAELRAEVARMRSTVRSA